MSDKSSGSSLAAPFWGVVVGVITFIGVNIALGRDLIPSVKTVIAESTYTPPAPLDVPKPGEGPAKDGESVYKNVCTACHQANGQGMPGAFPPLAGSSWVSGDAETPIRIVLLGLGGPIEVNGQKFNSMMPPPAGLDDEMVANVLTHVRATFGGGASAVTKEQVAAVRASLAGRTTSWTAEELTALRPAAGAAPAVDPAAAPGGAAPAPAPAGTVPAAAPAAPVPAAPAAPAGSH